MQKKSISAIQTAKLRAAGWRRDRNGRWHRGDSSRSNSKRQALLMAGIISHAVAPTKDGPTPNLTKKNRKGQQASRGRVPCLEPLLTLDEMNRRSEKVRRKDDRLASSRKRKNKRSRK